MTTGENIRNARKAKGWTQEKLGEKCGMKAANVRKYELDKAHPKFETLQRIADALEVSVWSLMPGPDPRECSVYEGFESYMKSIGFSIFHKVTKFRYDMVDDQPEPFRVEDETECVISKDGKSITLSEDEFLDLSTRTEDYIEGWFYKKTADQKKGEK